MNRSMKQRAEEVIARAMENIYGKEQLAKTQLRFFAALAKSDRRALAKVNRALRISQARRRRDSLLGRLLCRLLARFDR